MTERIKGLKEDIKVKETQIQIIDEIVNEFVEELKESKDNIDRIAGKMIEKSLQRGLNVYNIDDLIFEFKQIAGGQSFKKDIDERLAEIENTIFSLLLTKNNLKEIQEELQEELEWEEEEEKERLEEVGKEIDALLNA